MLVRLPFFAVISALVFVTVVPRASGSLLDSPLDRAAVGLVVGILVGVAYEAFRSRATRHAVRSERSIPSRAASSLGDAPRRP